MNKKQENLKRILESAGAKFVAYNKCLCPFHDDHRPSSHIWQAEDGVWRFKCFTCGVKGDYYDIMDKISNSSAGTAFKETLAKQKSMNILTNTKKSPRIYSLQELGDGGEVTRYWDDDKTQILLLTVRYEQEGSGKRFGLFTPDGKDGFVSGGCNPLPLLNRPSFRDADSIVVCEGEKCVKALHRVGIVATTKPCGAQSPEKADWTPLYGKNVILWPDNDHKGIQYMKQVEDLLSPHCDIRWIEPEKYMLPEKGDAYDYCEKVNWDKELARIPIAEAMGRDVASTVKQQMLDIASGRRTAVRWPWRQLGRLSQALIPQTTTLICGEGGDGKSLFMSQAMLGMYEDGVKFAVYDLEEDREHRVGRALAQREKDTNWLDYEWLSGKEAEVTGVCDRNADFMNGFGKCIWAAPDKAVKRDAILEWVDARAKEGCRVIIIDPITALQRPPKAIYEADEDFISQTKVLSRQYNVSIVYVTHPAKGRMNPVSLDGLQGGSAYGRFCQTVIWVEWVKEKERECLTEFGNAMYQVNRKVHLIKTRNGKGRCTLGYHFNKNTLTFEEYGAIIK